MADLSDVESALVAAITSAIYPLGTGSPSAIVLSGGANPNCRIFPGWPDPTQLDADMASGTLNVSVFAQPGLEKNTSRYERDWFDQFPTACTLTIAVSGVTITIGGTVTVGHFVTAQVRSASYSYAAQAGDTLATIATALAALINVGTAASATGSVITVASTAGGRITVGRGAPGTSFLELERQNQRFMVSIWSPNNDGRVAAARVVRPALAALDYLTYPDTSVGRIVYENSMDSDRSAKQSAMCRDIFFWVEYPTTQVMTSYPITTVSAGIEGDGPATPDFTPLPWSGFTPTKTVLN